MKVTLRKRESKTTNRVKLYLEFYNGYTKDKNGKAKILREYENLAYFLIKDPKTPAEKQHNKENQKGAEAVKAKRLLEIQNGSYGFANEFKQDTSLIEYFEKLTKERLKSKGNYDNWDSALKHLTNFCSSKTTFKDVTPTFVEDFREYLQNSVKTKSGNSLATNSALSYFNKFRAAINQAFDEGILPNNPLKRVKGIKQESTHREYLSIDDLRAIIKTDCRYEVLKRAFIFSCLTGLRWSDIQKLTWKEVQEIDGSYRIHFTQKKTKGAEYLPISDQAKSFMGNKGKPEDKVFVGLKYSSYSNVALAQWMLKSGVTKNITFHCARHTFATIQLTLGTDIYTVSKLLGHSELKTTQVYAKIIDQKKNEAVNKIPNLLI